MRLGIDLDGVVCDFPGRANAWLASELAQSPVSVDRWDWYKKYGTCVDEVWERLWAEEVPNGFFREVPAMPCAVESLEYLRQEGHQLVFITARPFAAGACTQAWLEDHGLGGHHLLMTPSSKAKQFTDPDVLLDDKGDTVFRHLSLGKSAVLFKRDWNREWWHRVPSISNWAEFEQLVDEMSKGVK